MPLSTKTALSVQTLAVVLTSHLHSPETAAQSLETLEFEFEHLRADDVSMDLYSLDLDTRDIRWRSATTLSVVDYSMEFEPAPFDFLGEATHLSHTAKVFSVSGNRKLSESTELMISGAYRDGFANYRALWLDTYFDQHFAPLDGVPGHELYENFEPSAISASTGIKWEYVPANAEASIAITRVQDNVSPGYEIDFDGIRRSDTVLATTTLAITTENVLARWARSKITFIASETTARETRYSGEIAVNAALSEAITLRAKAGGAKEDPLFEASYLDLALHLEATEQLDLGLSVRHYRDTGEIENALLFTTAAPELRSDSVGLTARFTQGTWRFNATATYSDNDYTERNANSDFFQTLYSDREWLNLGLAASRTF